MIGTVCRITMRQIYPTFYNVAKGFPCAYSMNLINAACISSSFINQRRVDYGKIGKLDVDQAEEDNVYNLPESRQTRQSSRAMRVRGRTEYISDEDSTDSVTDDDDDHDDDDYNDNDVDEDDDDDENVEFSFIELPRRGHAARLEMDRCTQSFLESRGLYLVKTVPRVQRILDAGILPKKIFFTRTSDLNRLKSDLKGVKLFKIDECDVLIRMQRKREPPFFAVCEKNVPTVAKLDAPVIESIPLVIAYSGRVYGNSLSDVMQAAMMCGCRELLFNQSFNSLFSDRFYIRNGGNVLNKIPSKFLPDWDTIPQSSDTCFYLLTFTSLENSNHGLPTVNLHEIDFWKNKEIVLVLAYSKITDRELEFCQSKNAKLIAVNGANEGVNLGAAAVGAVTFEIWRQWNARSKPKSKSKVNKMI